MVEKIEFQTLGKYQKKSEGVIIEEDGIKYLLTDFRPLVDGDMMIEVLPEGKKLIAYFIGAVEAGTRYAIDDNESVSCGYGCFKYMINDINSFAKADSSDNVNHPAHYETGKFECIDVMIETQGTEAVKDFCICNAFKYLYRHGRKNGREDIEKAIWYLNKYLELDN